MDSEISPMLVRKTADITFSAGKYMFDDSEENIAARETRVHEAFLLGP
jgi:hypothetical protein